MIGGILVGSLERPFESCLCCQNQVVGRREGMEKVLQVVVLVIGLATRVGTYLRFGSPVFSNF